MNHCSAGTQVVVKCHASTAEATDDQSLKQRRLLARRALAMVLPPGLSAGMQCAQVVLILLPGDVSCMDIGDQVMPVFLR